MTVLVCLDTETNILTRYDASKPEGLTHAGRLIQSGDTPSDKLVQDFLLFPPDELSVNPGARVVSLGATA